MIKFQTERLSIEEANLEDAPFIFEILNSPKWIEFIGNRNVKTLADAEDYIKRLLLSSYEKNGYGLFKMILKSEQKSIGICGLVNRDTLDNPDIGFAILPNYERKGYTVEAALATLEYAKSELGLEEILGITSEKNIASQNLLEKIGLRLIDRNKSLGEGDEVMLYSTTKTQ